MPLMSIPTLPQWKADTELRTPRSSAMKAVDKAIETYNLSRTPENLGKIRVALGKWAATKGGNWEQSERNKAPKRPITTLMDTVLALKARLPDEERAAVKFMISQQKTLLQRNFANASLLLPGFNAAVEADGAKSKIQEAVGKMKSAATGAAKAVVDAEMMKAVNELFGSELQEITGLAAWVAKETGAVALEQVAQHVAEMIPFVTLAVGGVKTLAQWGAVVAKGYKEWNTSKKGEVIAKGAPQAALQGLRDLMRRQTAFAAAKASITTAGFATNSALHAAKGVGAVAAPAVAAAQAAAQAVRVITLIAMQVREAVIMHKALKDPAGITFETLGRAPLLGCYVLVGASDSELIALAWDEFGQTGWMDEVDTLIKGLKPLMDEAAGFIQTSPFKLTGVPMRRSDQMSIKTRAKFLASWIA
jgi:hypothetical protein